MHPQTLFLMKASRVLDTTIKSPSTSFASRAVPQVSTAFVSFIASAIMANTIARTGNRLTVPYRRIIFGLSIADMAQSAGLLQGPFSVPSDTPNCWGRGNNLACHISSVIYAFGFLTVPLYTCFVCWYYLCKLKYRMSDETFALRTEKTFHGFIVIFAIALTFLAFVLDTFHVVPARTHCSFATIPRGCRVYPDFVGECDAKITVRVDFIIIIVQSLRFICFIGMISTMSMIYWHVMKQTRIFRLQAVGNTNSSPSQEHLSYISSLYRNEVVIQTICYVGAFCLTYMPYIIIHMTVITGERPPEFLLILNKYLLPLGGLFNILAYSRPQVAKLHREQNFSWLYCVWIVLKAGGELPEQGLSDSDVQFNTDYDPGNDNVELEGGRPRYSSSSGSPFGLRSERLRSERHSQSESFCLVSGSITDRSPSLHIDLTKNDSHVHQESSDVQIESGGPNGDHFSPSPSTHTLRMGGSLTIDAPIPSIASNDTPSFDLSRGLSSENGEYITSKVEIACVVKKGEKKGEKDEMKNLTSSKKQLKKTPPRRFYKWPPSGSSNKSWLEYLDKPMKAKSLWPLQDEFIIGPFESEAPISSLASCESYYARQDSSNCNEASVPIEDQTKEKDSSQLT